MNYDLSKIQFRNNVKFTLEFAPTSSGSTWVNVIDPDDILMGIDFAGGARAVATLANSAKTEIVLITSIYQETAPNTTCTVVRAREGTTAVDWSIEAEVPTLSMRLTAGAMSDVVDAMNAQSRIVSGLVFSDGELFIPCASSSVLIGGVTGNVDTFVLEFDAPNTAYRKIKVLVVPDGTYTYPSSVYTANGSTCNFDTGFLPPTDGSKFTLEIEIFGHATDEFAAMSARV